MRRRLGQALRIGVSPRAVALVATSRFSRSQVTVVAEQRCADSAIDTICASVRALLADAGCDGRPVTFVIADELARLWQVAPPPGSVRLADLEAAAGLRFQTLYGEAPLAWKVVADYATDTPFMAAALPRQLLALLEQGAAAHRLTVVEVVPQFVAGWNRWRGALKAGSWYGLVQEGVLTLGTGAAVRAIALPPDAGSGWIAQQIEREALRLNVPVPARLMVSGDVPESWSNGTHCSVLGERADWTPAVRLAVTGSAA